MDPSLAGMVPYPMNIMMPASAVNTTTAGLPGHPAHPDHVPGMVPMPMMMGPAGMPIPHVPVPGGVGPIPGAPMSGFVPEPMMPLPPHYPTEYPPAINMNHNFIQQGGNGPPFQGPPSAAGPGVVGG